MARYVFDINQPAGLLNPEGGESGASLLSGLNNNFAELYLGSGGVYIIQESDDISDSDWWSEKIGSYNTFSIINDFDFDEKTVVLPAGVVLLFNGGVWSKGSIVGDQSIFIVNGFRQAFEIDLLLSGTWKPTLMIPQYYGAITNINKTTYYNSCTEAIQACLDSLFNVYIPAGFYYIASGITISKPKTVYCEGVQVFDSSFTYNLDTTVLYSDQDIDYITITSGYVVWKNGFLDISNVVSHSHSGIRYNCGYNITRGSVDIAILGNLTSLIAGTNTGNGILFDTVNASANAETHFIKIKAFVKYLNKGIWVQGINLTYPYLFISDVNVDMISWGVVQSVRYEQGGRSYIKALCQDYKILSESNHNLPMIYISTNVITLDAVFYDYDESMSETVAPFSHKYIIENRGYWNILQGANTLSQLKNPTGTALSIIQSIPFASGAMIANSDLYTIAIEKAYHFTKNFISQFDNYLLSYDKRATIAPTLKKYNSIELDIDLETDLSESVGVETANVMITNANGMYSPRKITTDIIFLNESTKDTDYIEIVINETINLRYFMINIVQIGSIFNRLQLILTEDVTDIVSSYIQDIPSFNPGYKIMLFDFGGSKSMIVKKIVLRCIGINEINETIRISELICLVAFGTFNPLIDTHGDQTIYGNLAVNDGVKEVDLPVYADNAAAKVGGLVAGDPYRTATGVRMVVYD